MSDDTQNLNENPDELSDDELAQRTEGSDYETANAGSAGVPQEVTDAQDGEGTGNEETGTGDDFEALTDQRTAQDDVQHFSGSVAKIREDGERVLSNTLAPGEELVSEHDKRQAEDDTADHDVQESQDKSDDTADGNEQPRS